MMDTLLYTCRIFFETPKTSELVDTLKRVLENIPGVADLDIALPFNTARFMTTENTLATLGRSLIDQGIQLVSIHSRSLSLNRRLRA